MAYSRVSIDFRMSINPDQMEFYKPKSNLVGQWREEYPEPAPCNEQTELFFQPDITREKKGSPVSSSEAKAKGICASCDLIYLCLTDAVINEERHGIWGGMNKSERTKLRNRLTRSGKDVSLINILKLVPDLNSAAQGNQTAPDQVNV